MIRPGEDRLLIFDCDGVLVDSEPLANRVLNDALNRLGIEIGLEESTAKFTGLSMGSCIALAEDMLGRRLPDTFATDLERQTAAAFTRSLKPVTGVTSLLEDIEHPRCVASSGSHAKIRNSLKLTGLSRWFPDRALFSADDVNRGKPAPDLFLLAARRLGFPVSRCVVIEDSVPGVMAAVAAGMHVYGYAERTPPRQLRAAGATVFTRMHELAELLAERSGG
jgi:HAD superfamily hydrolase (TIGR01509 family)